MVTLAEYYVRGINDNRSIREQIITLLRQIGIFTGWTFSSVTHYYFIKSNMMVDRIPTSSPLVELLRNVREEISMDQFAKLCRKHLEELKELDWFRQLVPGAKVTIDVRLGRSYDYPCGFADGMVELAGKTFTIKNIDYGGLAGTTESTKRKMFNLDYSRYYLVESPASSYIWHSSMFVPIDINPIKRIELNDLSILSELM